MRFEELKVKLKDIKLIGEGWRSYIYRAEFLGKDVAVKVAKNKSVEQAINKEARILEMLKGMKNFPQILIYGEDFVLYEFIEGVPFEKCILTPEEKNRILLKTLELAYLLDRMCISKDEFHKLDKNLLVDKSGEVYIIDFERGKISCKRKTNITQFIQLLMREKYLDLKEAVDLGKAYIKDPERVFNELKRVLVGSLRETA